MMQLSKRQQAAIETLSPSTLVIAPAGSGKTRVLTSRIAHLIENCKVSPTEILAFTFTRKASGEIKERLEKISTDAARVLTGTMHGIALGFIYRFGTRRLTSMTVYSEWESDFLMRDVLDSLGLNKTITKTEMAEVMGRYYQEGIPPQVTNKTFVAFSEFLRRCTENNAMSYGMLLIKLRDLLPEIAKHTGFKHILVDEIQDIDALQWEIINTMCSEFGANLYVVGDPNQSIFSWRGAIPEYLVNHQHEFDIYHLHTNYRSDAHIVEFANKLIGHNKRTLGGKMLAKDKPKSPVAIISKCDSEKVMMLYQQIRAKHPKLKIAVLARNHFLLKKLSRLMKENEIEHEYIGQKTALANSEKFRRFHSFMRLLVNPFDNFAFLLARKYLGVSNRQYNNIMVYAAEKGLSHFQAYKFINELYASHDIFFMDPLDKPRFYAECIQETFPEIDETGEVKEFVIKWSESHAGGLKEYFDWLAVMDVQDEISDNDSTVQLMSIHAAKGLEWPIVIISGCNDGILPSSQSLKSGDLDSERRLAYVAWTRAQNNLIITCRKEEEKVRNVIKKTPISRFLKESQEDFRAPATP